MMTWTDEDAGEIVDVDDAAHRAHVRRLVYGSRVVTYWPEEPEPMAGAGGGGPRAPYPDAPTRFEWLLIALAWTFAAAIFGVLVAALGYEW
jgi:hypothetical protein